MLGSFLVVLGEGFEATLLAAIVLAYLSLRGWEKKNRFVWYGAGAVVPLPLATSLLRGRFDGCSRTADFVTCTNRNQEDQPS